MELIKWIWWYAAGAIIVHGLLQIYVLWVAYVVWTSLMQRKSEDNMSMLDKVFGYPVILTGFVIDLGLNLTLAVLIFLELPKWKEWTISERCMRHGMDALRRKAAEQVRLENGYQALPKANLLYRWRWATALLILGEIGNHDKSGSHTPKLPII